MRIAEGIQSIIGVDYSEDFNRPLTALAFCAARAQGYVPDAGSITAMTCLEVLGHAWNDND